MKVAVYGLGYIGSVTAACLAASGHRVIGVDTAEAKVQLVNEGRAPILEPGLDELVSAQVAAGSLVATADHEVAARDSDVWMICVGTPSAPNGSLDLSALSRITADLGAVLQAEESWKTVVYRSTMTPGTAEGHLIPLLEERSGRRAGHDFGVAVNPEFLREGQSLADFMSPSKTVIGQLDGRSGDIAAALYESVDAPLFRLSLAEAEMAKYIDNAYHAVKVAFANEIGSVCSAFELDSYRVMESFFADTRLNISPAYLKPGFAFGGSCLPKDLRALIYASGTRDASVPLLRSVLLANEEIIKRTVDTIASFDAPRIGVFGLAFKEGTDDLRESALVEVCERLLGKGHELKIYDGSVALARLTGTNRAYIDSHIPHIARLFDDRASAVAEHGDVFVLGAKDDAILRAIALYPDKPVVDLVRLPDASKRRLAKGRYVGIGW